jgi:hypothetical protein
MRDSETAGMTGRHLAVTVVAITRRLPRALPLRPLLPLACVIILAAGCSHGTTSHDYTDSGFPTFTDHASAVFTLDSSNIVVENALDHLARTICSDVKSGMTLSEIRPTVVQMLQAIGARVLIDTTEIEAQSVEDVCPSEQGQIHT